MTDTDLIVILIAAIVATWFFGYEVGSLISPLYANRFIREQIL